MSATVDERAILDSLRRVPEGFWGEVLRFLDSLGQDDSAILTGADLARSDLAGSWADRDDLGDSRDFARTLRDRSEARRGEADAPGH